MPATIKPMRSPGRSRGNELLQRPVVAELAGDDDNLRLFGLVRRRPVRHRGAPRLPEGPVVDAAGQELLQLVGDALHHSGGDGITPVGPQFVQPRRQRPVQVGHAEVAGAVGVVAAVGRDDPGAPVGVQHGALELVEARGPGGIGQQPVFGEGCGPLRRIDVGAGDAERVEAQGVALQVGQGVEAKILRRDQLAQLAPLAGGVEDRDAAGRHPAPPARWDRWWAQDRQTLNET